MKCFSSRTIRHSAKSAATTRCVGAGALDGVAASLGSACHSGNVELSPVLQAMGVPPEIGMGAIRFSLGRATTAEETDIVVERLRRILE